jgi:hypothetical protein
MLPKYNGILLLLASLMALLNTIGLVVPGLGQMIISILTLIMAIVGLGFACSGGRNQLTIYIGFLLQSLFLIGTYIPVLIGGNAGVILIVVLVLMGASILTALVVMIGGLVVGTKTGGFLAAKILISIGYFIGQGVMLVVFFPSNILYYACLVVSLIGIVVGSIVGIALYPRELQAWNEQQKIFVENTYNGAWKVVEP